MVDCPQALTVTHVIQALLQQALLSFSRSQKRKALIRSIVRTASYGRRIWFEEESKVTVIGLAIEAVMNIISMSFRSLGSTVFVLINERAISKRIVFLTTF